MRAPRREIPSPPVTAMAGAISLRLSRLAVLKKSSASEYSEARECEPPEGTGPCSCFKFPVSTLNRAPRVSRSVVWARLNVCFFLSFA